MKITLKSELDIDAILRDAVYTMQDALEVSDPGALSLEGGYETTSWEVEETDGTFTITIEVRHTGGPESTFDEVEDHLVDLIEQSITFTTIGLAEHTETSAK